MSDDTLAGALPAPPISPLVDLRDFQFMPLEVTRLRDSSLAATVDPEACWFAILLWCASWHQVPAGSLPDDDRLLARLAGFGRSIDGWMDVREGALHGWAKHSDGRLYHPTVVNKAAEAWVKKQQYAWRKACYRLRKENEKRIKEGLEEIALPTFEEWRADHG